MRGAVLGDLECGSEQVENILARSAGSSCRFGIRSLAHYRSRYKANRPRAILALNNRAPWLSRGREQIVPPPEVRKLRDSPQHLATHCAGGLGL